LRLANFNNICDLLEEATVKSFSAQSKIQCLLAELQCGPTHKSRLSKGDVNWRSTNANEKSQEDQ